MYRKHASLATLVVVAALIGATAWVASAIAGSAEQQRQNGQSPAAAPAVTPMSASLEVSALADWFGEAQAALEDGRTEEAMHLFELEIRQGGSSRYRAMEALEAARNRKAAQAEANGDFDAAAGQLALWGQLLVDLEQYDANTGLLTTGERQFVFSAKLRHSERLRALQQSRRAACETKAREILRHVEDAFARGKRPWYWNDDEAQFQDALSELNRAWRLEADLGEKVRCELANWHARLKSELSKKEYDETMEESRIVLGGSNASSSPAGGAQ